MNRIGLLLLLLIVWLPVIDSATGRIATGKIAGVAMFVQDEAFAPRELSGISESEAYDIEDGNRLDVEDPMLVRMMSRANKSSMRNFHRYSAHTGNLPFRQLVADPATYRLWVFNVSGRATSLSWHAFPEADEDTPIKGAYVTTLEISQLESETDLEYEPVGGRAIFVSRTVPSAWVDALGRDKLRAGETMKIDQSVEGYSFFLQLVRNDDAEAGEGLDAEGVLAGDDDAVPVFIGDRLGWYPGNEDPDFGISNPQALLAQAGVDIGRFDEVRRLNLKPFRSEDKESFYPMIGAVNRISYADVADDTPGDFLELVRNPRDHFGELVTISGQVRRCIEVRVTDEDVQERLGVDHYYELDMFVPIDAKISIDTETGEPLIYENRFPVTVVVAELPEGETPESFSRKPATMKGFFYRFWSYRNEFTVQAGTAQGQICPLIVGMKPELLPQETQLFDNILKYGIVVVLGGGIWMGWYFRNADRIRSIKSGPESTREELPEKLDVSGFE